MQELVALSKKVNELDELVRQLQATINSSKFVPRFTQRMMWAFLAISVLSLLSSLGILYGSYILSAKVHAMLNDIHNIYTLLE